MASFLPDDGGETAPLMTVSGWFSPSPR